LKTVRYIITASLLLLSLSWAEAQYISDVLEYRPAPGQFINTSPWGFPVAASTIVGDVDGSMCLGSFGGYVIFRFDEPVENHPDNPFCVDFSIFGNPMTDWSEPGIVSVMKDDNKNGLPDDVWYELAGSDFYFSTTTRNYEVTYSNPGDTVAVDVPWIDNAGKVGHIRANSFHLQPYYPLLDSFPAIAQDRYTLSGTVIEAAMDTTSPAFVKSRKRAFGYTDNQLRGTAPFTKPDNPYTGEIENSGGDAFDIGWAVDSQGNYMDLERIHFVKVQNAVLPAEGWLGELSTEITGAVDVAEDVSTTGELDVIVIRELPAEIDTTEYQLEAFVFHKGRLQIDKTIHWTSSMTGAMVDDDHVLTVTGSGDLVLTAALAENPEIETTVSTTIKLDKTTSGINLHMEPEMILYPNPAGDFITIEGARESSVSIYDASGKLCLHLLKYTEQNPIDITGFPVGFYLVKIDHGVQINWLKLLKQ